jgi:hypothetical protein
VNVHDALTLLVLVITPVATMLAVRIQLRGQADRDLYHFNRQRLEVRDATLRVAYIKVLNAAERLIDAAQDLKWFPLGRPHIERSEVFAGGQVQTEPQYVPIPRPNGDYSRVTQLFDEAQRLKSEATFDIGIEHDDDACLEFFDELPLRRTPARWWLDRNPSSHGGWVDLGNQGRGLDPPETALRLRAE